MGKRRFGKSLALAAVMGACFTAGAYAQDTLQKVEAYLRPDFTVRLNGQPVALPEPPLVYNGNSYLPFKLIGTMLGAQVSWDERTKSILVTQNPSTVGTPGQVPGNVPGSKPGSGLGYREIKLSNVVRYDLVYENVTYPTLANLDNDTGYLRWSDIQSMPFDMSGVTLLTEQLTKESYVAVEQVSGKWGGQVMMKLKNTPIYSGNYTEGQKKAIETYFSAHMTAFTVSHTGENEYYVLAQHADRKFVGYTLKLNPFANDYWSVSGVSQTVYSQS